MRLQYDVLFDVELIHTYFTQTPSAEFEIEPTSRCIAALKDSGLLFKKMPYGFCVVYEYRTDESGHKMPVRSISEARCLSFVLKAKSPHLVSYSELPLNGPQPGIYAFHNLKGNLRNGKYLLTSDITTSYATGRDLIELCRSRVTQAVGGDGSGHHVVAKNGFANTVLYIMTKPTANPVACEIDLEGHGPGQYSLEVDSVEQCRIYSSNVLCALRPFGVIDIFLGSSVPTGFSPVNSDGTITKKRFTIQIARRQLYWRYLIALKYRSSINAEGLSLTHPDSTISFIRGVSYVMVDGTTIVPFVSNRMLPLHSKALTGITLTKSGNGSGSFTVENLPNPSFENVIPNTAEGRVYSDVYVYI
jgi:hypothetical protein